MITQSTHEQALLAAALNPRQLAFANLILEKPVNQLSDAECYRKAGYKPRTDEAAESKASRLVSSGKVSAYIDSMKAEAANKTSVTLEGVLDEYQQAWELAREQKQPMAMIKATDSKVKLAGIKAESDDSGVSENEKYRLYIHMTPEDLNA